MMMMEAARTSEMLVNFYQTTWRYNPGDSNLSIINNIIFSFNSLFAIASSIRLAEPGYSHLKHTNKSRLP
jgi:hypothetical protein